MTTTKDKVKPPIYEALNAVMSDIKAVGKDGHNDYDRYNFRGIDGVMNAVGPVLRTHGVITVPLVEEIQYGQVASNGGKAMSTVKLRMRLQWIGPAGDQIDTVVWGEAFDRGDKATAKAHSVAYRTAVLQTLCLPTQQPDPDEESYSQEATPTVSNEYARIRSQVAATTDSEVLRGLWSEANAAGVLDEAMKALINGQVAVGQNLPPEQGAS